ncbi:MAG: hypothetical protein HKL80_00600 [Acidimicrobiales bacterium]|nr:hypothetical protein [Acidimicrobiales bacterium]
MLKSSWIVFKKDVKIEMKSRVLAFQVLPLAGAVLIIFGFALGPDNQVLSRAAPGLVWITILLVSLLAVTRSIAIEDEIGADGIRLFGIDPGGLYLGKTMAATIQVFLIGVVIIFSSAAIFNSGFSDILSILAMVLGGFLAVGALCSAGILFGMMSLASNVRETLLPLLFLPVAAPVVLAATKVSVPALGGSKASILEWLGVLAVLFIAYLSVGTVVSESLLEEN